MADKTPSEMKRILNLSPTQLSDVHAIEAGIERAAPSAQGADRDAYFKDMRRFGSWWVGSDKTNKPLLDGIGLIAVENGITKSSTAASIAARLQIDQMLGEKPVGSGELTLRFKGSTNCADITVGVTKLPDGTPVVADQKSNPGIFGAHDNNRDYNSPIARRVTKIGCDR